MKIAPILLPRELAYQWEDGDFLASCDWGMCDRPAAGWAQSDSDDIVEWLTICAECAVHNFAEDNHEPLPVDVFVSFPPDGVPVQVEP